ncbi:hypothetical protein COO91_04431 [Nostoc flagelliforme CCNUN1]|uniref:Uncharacterized protein n=1 Tax=Nostoc flagelliforme CCNUN1 TaxID=2038116 RepID=A0A2K8SSQ8_9NOSO|nr:hypothetical protein COO91_04431 [Nostoc flagelliforme CCNUN1]
MEIGNWALVILSPPASPASPASSSPLPISLRSRNYIG